MKLFKDVNCAVCDNKTNVLTRFKLSDGQYICGKCAATIPSYMKESVRSQYGLEEFKKFKEYCKFSKEELEPKFDMTDSYKGVNIDENHGIFCLNMDIMGEILYLQFKNIVDFDFEFVPEVLKEGILGDKVEGKVMFRLQMRNPEFYCELELDSSAKGRAKKSFFGNKISYEHPEKMMDFETGFVTALLAFEEPESGADSANVGTMQRDELQQAMSLFMIDSMDAVTEDEIKQQRNRLIKAFHPDGNGEIDEKFAQKINAAYNVLKQNLK